MLRERKRVYRCPPRAARAGERIAGLSQRTGNEWDIQTTAVINDIFANEPLEAGQLVKIAVSRPYEPSETAR